MTADLIPITGAPASPYTRKMLAVLRYRRIPYRFVQNKRDSELQKPKVGLIPIVYFRNQTGSLEPEIDSTPIIRRLEADILHLISAQVLISAALTLVGPV